MRTTIGIILFGVLVITGCGNKAPVNKAGGTNSIQSSTNTVAEDKKYIDAFGIVKVKTVKNINLEFPAVLEKKLVTEGQRVKLGEALFRFSCADYKTQIKNKSYELTNARFELKKASLELQKLQDNLKTAKLEALRAEKDYSGKKDLLDMGGVSKNEVDDYLKKLTDKQQEIREIERSLEKYTSGDFNNIEMQKTRISNLEYELAQLEDKLNRGFIRNEAIVSDFPNAIVSEIGYSEGDFITRERKICTLLDLDSLIVEANIPEEFIKVVRIGSRAQISPTADNSKEYSGRVIRIANLAVKNNGETVIPVEISLDKRDGFLLPNYNVDVKIY